jgi:hypothetical protein
VGWLDGRLWQLIFAVRGVVVIVVVVEWVFGVVVGVVPLIDGRLEVCLGRVVLMEVFL